MEDDKLHEEDLYGEQVREILNHPPSWLLLTGTTLVGLLLILAILLAYLVRYPDTLNGRITITAQIPAISLVSKVNGRIDKLFVSDNAKIFKGDKLALIESLTDISEIIELKKYLSKIDTSFETSSKLVSLPNFSKLGAIQPYFASFNKEYYSFKQVLKSNTQETLLAIINRQLLEYQQLLSKYLKQLKLLEEELNIVNMDYDRSKSLYENGVISQKEYELKRIESLSVEKNIENVNIAIHNNKIQLSNLESKYFELVKNEEDQILGAKTLLYETYQNLSNSISEWENNYLLFSPVDGKISYFNYWSENQNVKQGEEVFSIIPLNSQKIIGKTLLPMQNIGKLKIGQRAVIKLDNYPFAEFGILEGKVVKISSIPKQNFYSVEIVFYKGLITDTGKIIYLKTETQGEVSIITEDIRLIERIFYQIRKLFV